MNDIPNAASRGSILTKLFAVRPEKLEFTTFLKSRRVVGVGLYIDQSTFLLSIKFMADIRCASETQCIYSLLCVYMHCMPSKGRTEYDSVYALNMPTQNNKMMMFN